MSASVSVPPSGGMRRSHRVALVLLGATGVVGALTAIDAWRKSSADDAAEASPSPTPVVSENQAYDNNQFFSGLGYYHAPYHGWFPHPFNYYDAQRGYYAGGLWQAVPWVLAMSRSQPSPSAVAAARAAQPPPSRQPNPASYGTSGFHGGSWYASRPAGTPSGARPSIMRGGFGSSGHASGS